MKHKKIKSLKRICQISKKLQKGGKKMVFCHGFFDILHRGHVTLLAEAKKLGEILVVGADHDDNARIFKGPNRPFNDHQSRMFVLANLETVDYVFLIPSFKQKDRQTINEFYLKLYSDLKPTMIATSLKAGQHGLLKKKQAKKAGIKFKDINQGIYDKRISKLIQSLEKENENRLSS